MILEGAAQKDGKPKREDGKMEVGGMDDEEEGGVKDKRRETVSWADEKGVVQKEAVFRVQAQ